jgi:hypothetical protein
MDSDRRDKTWVRETGMSDIKQDKQIATRWLDLVSADDLGQLVQLGARIIPPADQPSNYSGQEET